MATKVPSSSPAPASAAAGTDLEALLRREQKKLALVQDVGRALSAGMDLDHLLAAIMEKVTELMDADRSTLYLLSDDGADLWSKVLQGGEVLEIRLGVGEGIAGWVALSGETVNIPDAYNDTRFQPAVDIKSGYRTRSILCVPMRNGQGATIGVLQVLNKEGGPFLGEDEELLSALAGQAAIAIDNGKLYHSVVAKNLALVETQSKLERKTRELNSLFEVEQAISAIIDPDALLSQILAHAMAAVGAAAGAIALHDQDKAVLRFRAAAGSHAAEVLHAELPYGDGIAGWCVVNRKAAMVNSPEHDARHAHDFARLIGREPRNLICAPLLGDTAFGVIELLDKIGPDRDPVSFDDADLKMLMLVAAQAAKAIQLTRIRAEEARQDRLASIGRMLAGVLHDLKTPMTIISGYAQLMAQIDDEAEREAYVEQILRQFDLMSGMTKEVLAFARGESDTMVRKVYVARFVEELQTHLEHGLAGREVRLEVTTAYDGTAYFDEQKILRVIHNLSRNAAEAMIGRPNSKLAVAISVDEEHFIVEVSDNGPGIPRDLEGRLFDLFATGRKNGTGLGLAIVKKIVDDHRGEIRYQSSPERGTRFTVRVPREKPEGRADSVGDIGSA